MPKLLSFGLNILADVLYPKYCFGCKRPGSYLCKFCVDQVPQLTHSFCIVCNKPSAAGFTHKQCKSINTPDRLLSALPYQNQTVADMIIFGKYHFIPELFVILGALTAHALLQNYSTAEQEHQLLDFIICPIPLHKQRQRWRGFNQTEVAGKILAQAFNIPCINILTRNKNTKIQKDLTAIQRSTNMQNAFTCQYQPPKCIILLDDVTTTGQTFLSATKVLKEQGATTVWCISIAKD